jgi:Holliday junction resolvasome RuvABC endonuclease subunit
MLAQNCDPKTIMGIDASATSSGVVTLYPSGGISAHLIMGKKTSKGMRLLQIHEALKELLASARPGLAVMEGPAYNATNKPFILGEVYGVIKLALALEGVPVVIVPPKSLKKFATGKGTASKADMVRTAQEEGLPTKDHDVADAWFAARLGQALMTGQAQNSLRASQEVIALLRGELRKKKRAPAIRITEADL